MPYIFHCFFPVGILLIAHFYFIVQYQQMLLNDSHETLIGTMDHLVVVNSLSGKKSKALKVRSVLFWSAAVC